MQAKKALKLTLMVMLCTAQSTFGWDLGIANLTPYTAVVWVRYLLDSCKYDYREIPAGQTVQVDAKECIVGDIEGFVVPALGKTGLNIKIKTNSFEGGRDFSVNIVFESKYEGYLENGAHFKRLSHR